MRQAAITELKITEKLMVEIVYREWFTLQLKLIPVKTPEAVSSRDSMSDKSINLKWYYFNINYLMKSFNSNIYVTVHMTSTHPSPLRNHPVRQVSRHEMSNAVYDDSYKLRMTLLYTLNGKLAGQREHGNNFCPRYLPFSKHLF